MNLRTFLAALLAAVCSYFLPRRTEPEYQFFWMGEESEVFVAPNLDALNRTYGRGLKPRPFSDELLTAENEGREWGRIDPSETCDWCEGEEYREGDPVITMTYQEYVERHLHNRPWFERDGRVAQLTTWYN